MKTNHKILFQNSNNIKQLNNESVDLMITSPPYPMIEMWDSMFSEQNSEIKDALDKGNGMLAFELMNKELDKVWDEVYRVLKPGGTACINIGDATRSINKIFQLYSSSSRILNHCHKIGFSSLPKILWRKTTNAPNKFMGSGMLPPGAYVTLEHEYILVLRKGEKREFKKPHEKENRQSSSFFWEERNIWFTDLWEGLKGVSQKLFDEKIRERSAAYPFDLAYRLINMFSVKGDVVLDPYFGTGTTMLAAMASGRNSVGVEIDPNFKNTIHNRTNEIIEYSNNYIEKRIKKHLEFVSKREEEKGPLKYENKHYGFKIMTRQEVGLILNKLNSISKVNDTEFIVDYLTDNSVDSVVINSEPLKANNNSESLELKEEKPPINGTSNSVATVKLSNFL